MKPNTLIIFLLAGTAVLGGCASTDSRYERYDDGGSRYYDGSSRYYDGARSNDH